MSVPWGSPNAVAREAGDGTPAPRLPQPRRLSVLVALALGSATLYPVVQDAGAAGVVLPPTVQLIRAAAPVVTPPAPNALPVPSTSGFVGGGVVTGNAPVTVGNTMTITQQSQKAILNWQSFDVGSDAGVIFDQTQGASSETLNRVAPGTAPSRIYGRVTAPGRVYVINQNGVVFGPTAQINVRGMIASALNITDDKFLNGWDKGTGDNAPTGSADSLKVFEWNVDKDGHPLDPANNANFDKTWVQVLPGARINTTSGGQVILMAPNVVNQGAISTPQGQTILAAGAKVYLQFSDDPALRGMLVEVDPLQPADGSAPIHGQAINEVLGRIRADEGNITLVGGTVKQLGTVEATTSVRQNGSIYLKAQDGVTFSQLDWDDTSRQWKLHGAQNSGQLIVGNGSTTRVIPASSADTSQDGQGFQKSVIQLSGGQITLDDNSLIQAPGGDVAITTETAHPSNYYFDNLSADISNYIDIHAGAQIDVSGTRDVGVSVSRNFVQVTAYSSELKDVPPERNGFLYRQPVWIDLRRLPKVADFSGYLSQIERTVDERTAVGGTISITTRGIVKQDAGSTLNVSGGSIDYLGGYGRTSQLVSGGKVYDISDAPANLDYGGFANVYTQHIDKWNVTRTWGGSGTGKAITGAERYYAGYVEGKSAGSINIVASQADFQGNWIGQAVEGPNQRNASTQATGGTFVLGNIASTAGHFWSPNVTFGANVGPSTTDTVNLSAGSLSVGGFSNVTVASDGKVTLPQGVALTVQPGGAVTIKAEQISVDGTITAPGGTINFATKTNTALKGSRLDTHLLQIGQSALLTARGLWTNDLPGVGGTTFAPVFTAGGQVTLNSYSDLEVATGSLIDASGGGWVNAAGKLQGGAGGAITLKTGDITDASNQVNLLSKLNNGDLNATLQAYGISKGGTLNLEVGQAQIGGIPNSDPRVLNLAESFFQRGGFAQYNITTRGGLKVAPGATVRPQVAALQLDSGFRSRVSGADMFGFTQRVLPIVADRTAAQINLNASNLYLGNLVVGQGASIATDIGGAIRLSAGHEIVVDGTLDAPAGEIALTLNGAGATQDTYYGNQYIWLGSHAHLLANGAVKTRPTETGLSIGDVLGGGQIALNAVQGYIVTEAGSTLEVSGTSGTVDVVSQGGASSVPQSRTLASDAGTISLTAREGMMLDGTYHAFAGGDSARGGTLNIELTASQMDRFGPRTIVLRDNGNSIPDTLQAGDPVESTVQAQTAPVYNGHAFVALDPIRRVQGGLDSLSLRSNDRIEFTQSTTDLSMRQRLLLDAPVIAAAQNVSLRAAYVRVGNTPNSANSGGTGHVGGATASGGNGELDIYGQLVDLVGDTALQGIGTVNIFADGDIRLRATPAQPNLVPTYTGRFASTGNINLYADQVYPTTLSDFTIHSDGTITIAPYQPGRTPSPVLSAGGRLTIEAPVIEQQGVLKAPLGEIDLNAKTSAHLAPQSQTSVAGDNQIIPFGYTELGGTSLFYDVGMVNGQSLRLQIGDASGEIAPPQKVVKLAAPSITMDAGAQVNVSGGGQLYTYEFTPGPPGRSVDILDPAARKAAESDPNASTVVKASAAAYDGTFAIVPALAGVFAPYDQQAWSAAGAPLPGSSVYLSGIPGLAAGTYALLPARYALLPGAFLVKPVSGYADMTATQRRIQPDGSTITSGYFTNVTSDGSTARDSRTGGFEVRTGASVRNDVDYGNSSLANWFAANGAWQTAADAGRLVISAQDHLNLNGTLIGAPGAGGQGSQVDLVANRIEITGDNATPDGFVQISASSLNNLHAVSLLIGGERHSTASGIDIDIGATNVTVANNSQSALTAPEIMLAAADQLTLNAGAVVHSAGSAQLSTAPITLTSADPANQHPGQGAFLRVASGAQVGLLRAHDRDAAGADLGTVGNVTGRLAIGSGAQLIADPATGSSQSSMILDATAGMTNAGALIIGSTAAPGDLAIGANRISLGGAPAGTTGLVLAQDNLNRLNGLNTLDLRSYSGIDFYGDVNLSVNRNLGLEAARLNGFGTNGQNASIHAGQNLRLSNPNGVVDPSATSGTVGALNLSAGTDLTLGAVSAVPNSGSTTVSGLQTVTLSAGRDLVVDGKGSLTVAGDLALNARRVTGRTGADYTIQAGDAVNGWHPVVLGTPGAPWQGTLPVISDVAARLRILGSRVADGGYISLPAGQLQLAAMGASAGDNVEVLNGAGIVAQGVTRQFDTRLVSAPGGTVTLSSARGSVLVDDTASIDVSGGTGGDAGQINVQAVYGALALRGQLLGGTQPASGQLSSPAGGSFSIDAGSIADFTAPGGATIAGFSHLNNVLESGGFTGKRYVRVRSGDLLLGSAEAMHASDVQLVTDHGAIDVAGRIDASGAQAGRIAIWANGALNVRNGAVLDAHATGSNERGGSVLLATQDTSTGISVENGAAFKVAGTGAQANSGTVALRAPRTPTGVAVSGLHGAITGAKEVVVEANQTYAPIPADGDLGGTINRALADTASFMASAAASTATQALQAQLAAANPSQAANAFHFRPGIEVDGIGDLVLGSNLNLQTQRFGANAEPGVLTVRTTGQLQFNANLSDGFSDPTAGAGVLQSGNSWSYRLVAGADASSADVLAAQSLSALPAGSGSVVLADGALIRTGTGDIAITAGRNVNLGSGAVIYTAGQADMAQIGDPSSSGPKFNPRSNEKQTYPFDGGDLSITAGGNIVSAQPTTNGVAYQQIVTDWLWRFGNFGTGTFQRYLSWWPRFDLFKQGVGTLGGGDVSIEAGGDLENLSVALPTNGRLPATVTVDPVTNATTLVPDLTNLRVLGGGNMQVHAGGDIRSGVFYMGAGSGKIAAGGSITSNINVTADNGTVFPLYPILSLGDAQLAVTAGGSLTAERVMNPTVFPVDPANLRTVGTTIRSPLVSNFYTYSAGSAVTMTAITGSVTLANNSYAVQYSSSRFSSTVGNRSLAEYLPVVYPSTLRAVSLLGDVTVNGSFPLFPSPTGELELLAGGSVRIPGTINVPDLWPSTSTNVPGLANPTSTSDSLTKAFNGEPIGYNFHSVDASGTLLHAGDAEPIRIIALDGDVVGTVGNRQGIGYFPKPALIEAGRDLIDIGFYGQNLKSGDVTRVRAGRDLRFNAPTDNQGNLAQNETGIFVGGPGRVEVTAGRNIDLGNSKGILTEGNLNNPYLPEGGATLMALAGSAPAYSSYGAFLGYYLQGDCAAGQASYVCDLQTYMRARLGDSNLSAADALAQFNQLKPDQQTAFVNHILFSEMKQTGDDATNPDSPRFGNYQRGYDAIARLFPANGSGPGASGDIHLYYSQLKTEQGGDIELFAPYGQVNAGLPTVGAGLKKTAAELGIVTVQGGAIRSMTRDDFLVNSQRVFTLQGGDILLWSSDGNIDAGRGAKTSSATPPARLRRKSDGTVVLDLTQSIAGSGIAALRANPDVAPGNVELIAPRGTVNAGEAGIRALANLNIAAQQVSGADNIQVGGHSTGLPVADTSGATAAAAASSTAGTAKSTDDAIRNVDALGENDVANIDVEVLGFGDNERQK